MARLYKNDPVLHERALRALVNLHSNRPGVFERAMESKQSISLHLADGSRRKVEVQGVDTYDFTVDGEVLTKLDVLYVLQPKAEKKLKKVARKDGDVAKRGLRPTVEYRERLKVSKMLFQKLIDESLLTRFTMLDGAVIPCRLRSFNQFEVDVNIKGGGEATIFRHGLYRISVGEEILADLSRGTMKQGRPRKA